MTSDQPKPLWGAPVLKPYRGPLSTWLEEHVRLPEGLVAEPGPLKLYPYQIGIANALTDPWIERVTLVKSVRVGYTALLTASIPYWIKEEPCPILVIQPTEPDCRDWVVSDLEPLLEASPTLRNLLPPPSRKPTERSRVCHRVFHHGSLKVVSARAPRNLRRHTARVLLLDEIDAYEYGVGRAFEGDPIKLAERRTLSFANRKIIAGSTPLNEDTSPVLKLYAQSDQRIYEVPCPDCGTFTEILWQHIEWEQDQPHTASFRCPHCNHLISERFKSIMVANGHWRVTKPNVRDHAGFRLNALISALPNASWAKLAAEFVVAKENPESLRVFVNTILAQGWRSSGAEGLDEDALAARAERFDLTRIPADVVSLTCGIDVQREPGRLECTVVGWTRLKDCLVLEHRILYGSPMDDDDLWQDLDEFLQSRFQHPNGGRLKIDATVIDCADGIMSGRIINFCTPRSGRKVLAARGVAGFYRSPIARTANRKIRGSRSNFWLVGVDALKQLIFTKLSGSRTIRFSDTLTPEWFAQLCSERRVVRYSRGKPTARFERIPGLRAEALDCLVYATAAHSVLNLNIDARETELAQAVPPARPPEPVIRSAFMDHGRV